LIRPESAEFRTYRSAFLEAAGRSLEARQIEWGFLWAAVQIPVQYLPWTLANRSSDEVEVVLDRIEEALGDLDAGVSS
jgi:hypothetical protein